MYTSYSQCIPRFIYALANNVNLLKIELFILEYKIVFWLSIDIFGFSIENIHKSVKNVHCYIVNFLSFVERTRIENLRDYA